MSDKIPLIVDPTGQPIQSIRHSPCPMCGRTPDKRVPSASFGEDIYLICPCGNEFNRELKWQRPIL